MPNIRPKRHQLFLVDDDEVVRTSLARRLRRQEFEVHEFEAGELLIEYLDHAVSLPDVIILDFNMVGLNGIETARLIRQRSSIVPVIMLTAYPGVIDVQELTQVGVFKLVTKNVELENLRGVIKKALQIQ